MHGQKNIKLCRQRLTNKIRSYDSCVLTDPPTLTYNVLSSNFLVFVKLGLFQSYRKVRIVHHHPCRVRPSFCFSVCSSEYSEKKSLF